MGKQFKAGKGKSVASHLQAMARQAADRTERRIHKARRQGKARQGKARQGKARARARQGKGKGKGIPEDGAGLSPHLATKYAFRPDADGAGDSFANSWIRFCGF